MSGGGVAIWPALGTVVAVMPISIRQAAVDIGAPSNANRVGSGVATAGGFPVSVPSVNRVPSLLSDHSCHRQRQRRGWVGPPLTRSRHVRIAVSTNGNSEAPVIILSPGADAKISVTSDLRPRLPRGEYVTLVAEIHDAAISTVRLLPNYGNLRGDALRVAARSSAREGEVLSVVRLFQWLLPGLVANIAFFRA